jgi:hypothetical protein
MTAERLEVPLVVEGTTDVPFAEQLIRISGGIPGTPYVQGGKPNLLKRVAGYANGARHRPWLALVDLDADEDCAPTAWQAWRPNPSHSLVLRVVVHAIEAWALGDRESVSAFFGVRSSAIPPSPEVVADPKGLLIDLARSSRRAEMRRSMVPRPGSGRRQGPGYEARLIEFGHRHWDIERARLVCPSLERAVTRLSTALGTISS